MLSRVWQAAFGLILMAVIGLAFRGSRENIKHCKEHCHESYECRQLMATHRNACAYLEGERIRRILMDDRR